MRKVENLFSLFYGLGTCKKSFCSKIEGPPFIFRPGPLRIFIELPTLVCKKGLIAFLIQITHMYMETRLGHGRFLERLKFTFFISTTLQITKVQSDGYTQLTLCIMTFGKTIFCVLYSMYVGWLARLGEHL